MTDGVNKTQYIKSVEDSITYLEEYRDYILNTVTITGNSNG